eukprot:11674858-Karenia_brevis.AAC.1
MASVEEKLSELERSTRERFENLKQWGVTVDTRLGLTEAKHTETDSKIQWLIQQYEIMSHKERDKPKGLKRAF